MVGGCFPLFARQMFDNLGVQWAGTLLGCLSLVMIPIPFGFIVFGKRLRAMSKYKPLGKGGKIVSNESSENSGSAIEERAKEEV